MRVLCGCKPISALLQVVHLPLCPDGKVEAAALTLEHGAHDRITEAFEELKAGIHAWSVQATAQAEAELVSVTCTGSLMT